MWDCEQKQIPEIIHIGKAICTIEDDDFFPTIPEDHPLIEKNSGTYVWSAICHRGYQAAWMIENDCLYLKEFSEDIPYRKYKKTESPIIAIWFTGVLRIRVNGYDDLYVSVKEGVIKSAVVETLIKILSGFTKEN